MSRVLNNEEKVIYIENREELHEQLAEMQADFEDFTDEELIDSRNVILKRINNCLDLILETDEDNLK